MDGQGMTIGSRNFGWSCKNKTKLKKCLNFNSCSKTEVHFHLPLKFFSFSSCSYAERSQEWNKGIRWGWGGERIV